MNKIITWLNGNMDKVCHFCICLVIAIVFGAIIFHTTVGATAIAAATCGLIAAFIVGLIKEVCDTLFLGGVFGLKDLFADTIGGMVGAILLVLLFV